MMSTDFDETHREWCSYRRKTKPKIISRNSKDCLFYRGAKFGSFFPLGVGFQLKNAILKSSNWDNDKNPTPFW
jgi:hypothetical protein